MQLGEYGEIFFFPPFLTLLYIIIVEGKGSLLYDHFFFLFFYTMVD